MDVNQDQIACQQQRVLLLVQARDKYNEHIQALKELNMVISDLQGDFIKESIDVQDYISADTYQLAKNSPPFSILNAFKEVVPIKAIRDLTNNMELLSTLSAKYIFSEKDFLSTYTGKISFEKGTPEDTTNIDINAAVRGLKEKKGVATKYYRVSFYMVKGHEKRIKDALCVSSDSDKTSVTNTFFTAVRQAKYDKAAAIHIGISGYRGKGYGGGNDITCKKLNAGGSVEITYVQQIVSDEPIWVNQDADVVSKYIMNKI